MKKLCLIGLAVALLMPVSLFAEVPEGSMAVGVHIDFVGRYSAEDNKDPDADEVEWEGYETLNLEAAVLYLSGKVGDNVTWVIGEALTMPAYDEWEVSSGGEATLLDAKITWNITDSIALNMGRYIPATSMSVSPHRLAVHHLVDAPMMITGGNATVTPSLVGDLVAGAALLPLPHFQTGVGISVGMGPATISWDLFDGVQGNATPNSLMEQDRSKGGVIKVAVDSGSLHGGLWYMNEHSDGLIDGATGWVSGKDADNDVTRWGLEVAYTSERIIAAAEYVDTVADFGDELAVTGLPTVADDCPDLKQMTYYILVGANVGPVQLVLRYDYVEAGLDEFFDDIDGIDVDEDEWSDQQANTTIGVNYGLNDNTTIAINYAMRAVEEPDDWEYPNIDELSVLVELDLL